MKNRNLLVALAAIVISFSACKGGSVAKADGDIKTSADTVAYSLGMSVGKNLKQSFPDVSADLIAKGIAAAYEGKENTLFVSPEEADNAIRTYLRVAAEKKGLENKAKGEAFLAENAKKSGVTVTASGLQYEVIKQGTGAKPTAESTVTVHYHGTTIDGEVFDSSVERGEPATFPLNGVIKGWTEGVQLMSVGSKYKFYVPSVLAYGERGAGQKIGPNSALVFEVELLEIAK